MYKIDFKYDNKKLINNKVTELIDLIASDKQSFNDAPTPYDLDYDYTIGKITNLFEENYERMNGFSRCFSSAVRNIDKLTNDMAIELSGISEENIVLFNNDFNFLVSNIEVNNLVAGKVGNISSSTATEKASVTGVYEKSDRDVSLVNPEEKIKKVDEVKDGPNRNIGYSNSANYEYEKQKFDKVDRNASTSNNGSTFEYDGFITEEKDRNVTSGGKEPNFQYDGFDGKNDKRNLDFNEAGEVRPDNVDVGEINKPNNIDYQETRADVKINSEVNINQASNNGQMNFEGVGMQSPSNLNVKVNKTASGININNII